MKKLIDFKHVSQVELIQQYADKNHEGNFNLAVRTLIKAALKKGSK